MLTEIFKQPLQPTSAEVDESYSSARRYWNREADAALHELKSGLNLERFELRNMLGRIPPIPARTSYGLMESFPLESKWHITGSKNCEASGKPIQIPPVQLRLLIRAPTKVTLRGNSFRAWTEFEGNDQPNLLAILVLAWSYILSARLMELQGRSGSQMVYTRTTAPLYQGDEIVSSFPVDVGDVDSRTVRWFTAVLAPGRGFRVALLQENTYSHHAPWEISLVAPGSPFSIQCGEDRRNLEMSGQTPLNSHEALQSLIGLCNRHGVSHHQLHAALATALLLPTHNYLNLDSTLPCPRTRNSGFLSVKLCSEDLDQLFNDLPYYITLSCGGDVINSSLCGVFWNPLVSSNLVSPWLQPLWDLNEMSGIQDASGQYAEVIALICARRAPNIAFLSIGAAISGLTSKILGQVSTGQPPLEPHAYAWTGVPQSFMDIAGEGRYYEMCSSKAYIRRSDCWRLRKLPPVVDDDLHYGIGPFTPWEPPGYALLKNCPLRVQVHKDCDRHTIAYKGSTWCFKDGCKLDANMGRDLVTPHVFPNPLPERELFHDLRVLDNEDTSIDATIASFRWVLDNGEGSPPEDAYKDPWLLTIYDNDSEDDGTSVDSCSSTSEGSQEIRSNADGSMRLKAWIHQASSTVEEKDFNDGVLYGG